MANRDGIPATVRDQANRALFDNKYGALKTEAAGVRSQLKDAAGPSGTAERFELKDKLKAIQGKLDAMDSLKRRLDQPANTPPEDRYYLLDLDTNADGKAIVAKGNPDTAANVATYVPGTGADLAGVNDGIARSDRLSAAADEAGSLSTSVITWYGYDAPDSIANAVSRSYAENASRDLNSFQDGLRASHEAPPSHHTVLGHSYGGPVIGEATDHDNGLAADDLVFVGAPGVGAVHANELNMPDGHVWATADPDDPVPDAPVHGIDPTDPDFGAKSFESDAPGIDVPWYRGHYDTDAHSAYWEPGNPALDGMGKIIAEGPPE